MTHQHDAPRPDEPFKSLGNETRLDVLHVLYDHMQRSAARDAALSYSTLRERVGVADKGNFNYHLRQLDDQFVEQRPEGYRLTFAGFEIAKVIDIDAWRSHEPRGPIEIAIDPDGETTADDLQRERETDTETAAVEKSLTATYEDSVVEIRQGERPLFAHAVRPTGAADRDVDELLNVASTLWRHTIDRMLSGICPYCHTTVDRSIDAVDAIDEGDGDWKHTFSVTCPECGPLGGSHVAVAPLTHPAVVSFYWDHGIDIRDRQVWHLPFVRDDAVTVVSDAPRRRRVDIEHGGERLSVTIGEDVQVLDTARDSASQ